MNIRQLLKKTPARFLYHRTKSLFRGKGQSDEAQILKRLATGIPKTFVEFGFHPTEYNCIGLDEFTGLLIDGDKETVELPNALTAKRIEARQCFLTLDNLSSAINIEDIGVLAIDVDGNDFWFLNALLPMKPHVISIEYNASFGRRSITVPYDPNFERHAKHPSGWYHGASLAAITKLCNRHKMKLVAVASGGAMRFLSQIIALFRRSIRTVHIVKISSAIVGLAQQPTNSGDILQVCHLRASSKPSEGAPVFVF